MDRRRPLSQTPARVQLRLRYRQERNAPLIKTELVCQVLHGATQVRTDEPGVRMTEGGTTASVGIRTPNFHDETWKLSCGRHGRSALALLIESGR